MKRARISLILSLVFLLVALAVRPVADYICLVHTEAALLRGELPDTRRGLAVMSPKGTCLKLTRRIDAQALAAFLEKSDDEESKAYVACILAWRGRTDLAEAIGALVGRASASSARALLALVALEQRISFPQHDFAAEYFGDYATEAMRRARYNRMPLRAAAEAVALELRVKYANGEHRRPRSIASDLPDGSTITNEF